MNISEIYNIFKNHPNVITDSRKIEKKCLFFALKGENFNGNRFAAEAIEKGAAFAFIDELQYKTSEKTIQVDNVLETLQKLARFHRQKLNIPVIGITGSNGKTTTKELIAAVLGMQYNVSFTQGNLNNHIGVPLSLLKINNKTEVAVIEMGANHQGEIGKLCSIADPDYGIITNIGHAHLEGFGDYETIIKTKAELYSHLKNRNGTIFYNSENPILKELTADYSKTVQYGKTGNGIIGEPILSSPFINVKVSFPNDTLIIKTQLTGNYNFENIMAAVCIGHYFDISPSQIQKAIKNYSPQNNRSQLIEKNNLKIIMDAYNANPSSMKASIDSFAAGFDSPRYLILGDMLELGEQSLSEHHLILELTKKHLFEAVFLAGPVFKEAALKYNYQAFENTTRLCEYLSQNPIKSGNVLIKGSRGLSLEKVLEFL